MRRYSTSPYRVGLLAIMLLAVVAIGASGLAQTTARSTDAAATNDAVRLNLMELVAGHLDFVFYTIFALSVTGLALIINGFIRNRKSVVIPDATIERMKTMIEQRRYRELQEFTARDKSFVSRSLYPALRRAPSFSAMRDALETSVSEQTAEQFRQIEYLNIIGNLGPLLGLLGTVLGMIEAFQAMHQAQGQTNPAQLAGGISTALTHTFLGLLLAVPCLAAFGVLRTMVDRLTVRGAMVAEDLLLMIKAQESKKESTGGVGAFDAAATVPSPLAG